MIVSRVYGGIGNQIWQYSYGLSQARRLNTTLKLDTYILDKNPFNYTPYDYYLSCFDGIKEEITSITSGLKLYEEGKSQGDITNDSVLDGYWQNEKYFENVKDELRKKLVFKDDIKEKIRLNAEIIKNLKCVSIHIRRGDYMNGDYFVDLSKIGYYQKAISYFKSIDPTTVFCVFSNDIEWSKKFLNFDNKDAIFLNNSTAEDLYLMSLCKHNITANSTYSWWGGWINSNLEKVIIQPQKWFKNKDIGDLKLQGSILM